MTCATCRFWVKIDAHGACHALPPSAVAFTDELDRVQHALGAFPLTRADDWCGSHDPANGAAIGKRRPNRSEKL